MRKSKFSDEEMVRMYPFDESNDTFASAELIAAERSGRTTAASS